MLITTIKRIKLGFIAITIQSVKILIMKKVLAYMFMVILLIPSVNAQGIVVNYDLNHATMPAVQNGEADESDCHEKQPQVPTNNSHDCCDEQPEHASSCEHDCNNCAEDITSNSSAIFLGSLFLKFQLSHKIPVTRYHLPVAPSQRDIIPPII